MLSCKEINFILLSGIDSFERSIRSVILKNADWIPQQWEVLFLGKGFVSHSAKSCVRFTDLNPTKGQTLTWPLGEWPYAHVRLRHSPPWTIHGSSQSGRQNPLPGAKPSVVEGSDRCPRKRYFEDFSWRSLLNTFSFFYTIKSSYAFWV